MRVLGLSFSGHGSSVCLVEDGRIACAVNLERITRQKFSLVALPELEASLRAALEHSFGARVVRDSFDFYEVFPKMLEYVTGETDLARAGIDLVVKTPDRVPRFAARGENAAYDRFREFFAGTELHDDLEHHLAHAYQAFLCSPFDEAAVLTVDGTGERLPRLGGRALASTFAAGEGERVRVLHEIPAISSLGGMYSQFTAYLGFDAEQEGNTMALAAFGTDAFYRRVEDAFTLSDGGHYQIRFGDTFDQIPYAEEMRSFCPPRSKGEPFEQGHKDLAWGAQALTEKVLVHVARGLRARTGLDRIAIAGGVGLNCVANAKILTEGGFREIYVMPNAGDRGLAAGCALWGYHVLKGQKGREPPRSDALGRAYTNAEIEATLRAEPRIEYRRSDNIARDAARLIESGKIIGWVQDGCEFGPRALGHRSILADPRTPHSKERLDRDIKRREWFRPYAPSVLEEHADRFFEMHGPSPYMLQAVRTRDDVVDDVRGIVHVDGSARVQTVNASVEPRYHALISAFYERTGIPMVLNTSFNGYGEPMVETPGDAVTALLSMSLDALAVGDYLAWPQGRPASRED